MNHLRAPLIIKWLLTQLSASVQRRMPLTAFLPVRNWDATAAPQEKIVLDRTSEGDQLYVDDGQHRQIIRAVELEDGRRLVLRGTKKTHN
jgi:hypothetical protein